MQADAPVKHLIVDEVLSYGYLPYFQVYMEG